jgi:ribonuclease R
MTTDPKASLRDRLIAFLAKHSNETFKPMVLARRLSLDSDDDIRALRALLSELQLTGEVGRSTGRRFGRGAPPVSNRLTGVFKAIRQGQGIVETSGTTPAEKILIASKFRGTAIDGDTVTVSVFARPISEGEGSDALPEGEVVDVVSRRTRAIIGTFEKGKNFFFVIPDSSRIGRDIYIPPGKTAGAQHGEKVAAKILSWESEQMNPEGEVVTVLGKAGDVHVEMRGIREEFQLPEAFPAAVMEEVAGIPDDIPRAEIDSRLDLRDDVSFTIDPADAKDHDDALSIRTYKDGRVEVGVHIADVSHYVTEGSALDEEAYDRGTSVYLPGTVIPMLPEKLSADLCSLMPDVDRLAYSVMLIYSRDGRLEDYEIRKSVIHLREGFSYEEAQEIIETGEGPCAKELRELHRISRILLEARMKDGSIDFESPEVAFRFDDAGLPSEIVKKERLHSHRLIEEFMLQANQVVAGHIGKARKDTAVRPFVYRVHDYPEPGKLRDFSSFVQHLGYSFNVKSGVTSRAFQKLLSSVKGHEEENVINQLAIRSMAKAVYSPENIGHFGLGFKHYTHFTSPIRRYPDLIVHRLLHEYEAAGRKPRTGHWETELPDICSHSSARERVATDAERASIKVMQVEYMKRHVGDVFHALVSGVTNFGLFVEINDLLVEGMIRLRDLRDDFYVFDEKKYQLVGRRTGQAYRLGDRVTVKVVRVDPEDREMDFIIVDQEGQEKHVSGPGDKRDRGGRGGGSGKRGRSDRGGRGARKQGEHKQGEHKQGEHKQGEHKQGEHKQGAHTQGEHKEGAHKQGAHKQGAHKQGERKEGAHKQGAHKQGERKEGGSKPAGEKQEGRKVRESGQPKAEPGTSGQGQDGGGRKRGRRSGRRRR